MNIVGKSSGEVASAIEKLAMQEDKYKGFPYYFSAWTTSFFPTGMKFVGWEIIRVQIWLDSDCGTGKGASLAISGVQLRMGRGGRPEGRKSGCQD
jgi:hypothetical protein